MSKEMNLVTSEPVEWASDDIRGFFGYSVHINNGVWPEHVGFPAFTHEQMLKCKKLVETLGEKYSWEEWPHLIYDEDNDTWSEIYYDDMSDIEDVMHPFYVDGLKLYELGGRSGWAWGLFDADHAEDYHEVG